MDNKSGQQRKSHDIDRHIAGKKNQSRNRNPQWKTAILSQDENDPVKLQEKMANTGEKAKAQDLPPASSAHRDKERDTGNSK